MIDLPRETPGGETNMDNARQPTEAEVAAEIAAAFTPELIAALPPEAAALLPPEIRGAAPSVGESSVGESSIGESSTAPHSSSGAAAASGAPSPSPDPNSTAPWPEGPHPNAIAKIKSVEDDSAADDWHDPFSRLTPVQQHVVLGLSRGLPKSFLANEFGISQRTIQRWKNCNDLFQRALEQLQLDLRSELVGQLRDAAELAVRNVASAVKKGKNAWLAFQLIRELGLAEVWNSPTPSRSTPRSAAPGAAPHNRISGVNGN
jgi:hypothetical protein